ncbi:MAG: hypothetical protein ACI8RA_002935 [Chlamydiales bacterium]|jgi:hypothetical protein
MSVAVMDEGTVFLDVNLDSEKPLSSERESTVAKVSSFATIVFQGIASACVELWERKEAWLTKVENKCYPLAFVLRSVEGTFTTPVILVYRSGKYTVDGAYRRDVNTSVRHYMHDTTATQKASDMGKVFIKVGSSLTVSTVFVGAIAFGHIPVVLSIVGASIVGAGVLESNVATGIQSCKENEGFSELSVYLKENLMNDARLCMEGATYGAISGAIVGGVLAGVVAASSTSICHAATARPAHALPQSGHSAHAMKGTGAPLDNFRNSGGDALLTVTALRVGPHAAGVSSNVLEDVKVSYETISTVNETLDSAEKDLGLNF